MLATPCGAIGRPARWSDLKGNYPGDRQQPLRKSVRTKLDKYDHIYVNSEIASAASNLR
jgi:hypothetical protein